MGCCSQSGAPAAPRPPPHGDLAPQLAAHPLRQRRPAAGTAGCPQAAGTLRGAAAGGESSQPRPPRPAPAKHQQLRGRPRRLVPKAAPATTTDAVPPAPASAPPLHLHCLPPPPLPPPPPPPPKPQLAVQAIGGKTGAAVVGAGVAGASGGGAASQLAQMVLLSEVRCEGDGDEGMEDPVVSPLGLVVLGSARLGAVVGNLLVCAVCLALHFTAVCVCSVFSPTTLQKMRVAPHRAVLTSWKHIATALRFPGAQLMVVFTLYSGTVFAAWASVFTNDAAPALISAALGLVCVGCGVPFCNYNITGHMLAGVAHYEREEGPKSQCRCFWMGSGDWVSATDGWFWRWGTGLREMSARSAGQIQQVATPVGLFLVSLLVAIPKGSLTACAISQGAICAVFSCQVIIMALLLPYCRRRDRVFHGLHGALQGAAACARMIGHIGGKTGNEDPENEAAAFKAAQSILMGVTAVIVLKALADMATELFSILTRRRARLQQQHHEREGFWGDGMPREGEITEKLLVTKSSMVNLALQDRSTVDGSGSDTGTDYAQHLTSRSGHNTGRRGSRRRRWRARKRPASLCSNNAQLDTPLGTPCLRPQQPPDAPSDAGVADDDSSQFVTFGGREFIRAVLPSSPRPGPPTSVTPLSPRTMPHTASMASMGSDVRSGATGRGRARRLAHPASVSGTPMAKGRGRTFGSALALDNASEAGGVRPRPLRVRARAPTVARPARRSSTPEDAEQLTGSRKRALTAMGEAAAARAVAQEHRAPV
eukprot:TRINITY_DN13766_c0_g1_i1.p1 TRINITY_DN13766_c0_g1~~TRINITY_DN13766_c0_g1_i1.p1  ORF type:complete len:765 (+),score=114.92 TRINITY_DN13766_c0_g1_i1:86-2380(+)